jgi:hypothetical protein
MLPARTHTRHRFRRELPGLHWTRVAVLSSTALLAAAACSGDTDESSDTESAATSSPIPAATPEQVAAVEAATMAYQADLVDMQARGQTALAPGDVAAFYATFATTTRDAVQRYSALDLPADSTTVHQRVLELLDEQAQVLDEIATRAAAGENDTLGPELDRLTELLGDVATANAELLRHVGLAPPDGGGSADS